MRFHQKKYFCLINQVEEDPSPQPALQQIRIVNSDGTVTMGTVGGNQRIVQQQQPVQQAQQNIRVLNSDGTITSLNSSNIRLAMQQVWLLAKILCTLHIGKFHRQSRCSMKFMARTNHKEITLCHRKK